MELVKKYGLWIIGAVLIIAAIALYFLKVRNISAEYQDNLSKLEKRRNDLQAWTKKPIPNPTSIKTAEEYGLQVTAQLADCELYLARQPRRAQTRNFFEEERFGQEKEIDAVAYPNRWLEIYKRQNALLQEQLTSSKFGNFSIANLEGLWGAGIPKPDQIAAAMELYWYQKDLADFLTEQPEKDLAELIKTLSDGRADFFPGKPFDLVVNRKPSKLDEILRTLPQKKLIPVLDAILINERQQDLATIFNTLLPDEVRSDGAKVDGFPWERAAGEQDKYSVLGLTMDEQQKKFLDSLVPLDRPEKDLADRARFLDFVREMRTVRYRSDVVYLLENKRGFEDIAISIRRGTDDEYARVRADISNWSTTQLAQAIAEVVSIKDEKDYRVIRNNHSHGIVELGSITLKHGAQAAAAASSDSPAPESGKRGGSGSKPASSAAPAPSATPGANDLFKPSQFSMRVKIEFERIPVFIRRLLTNSWRYRITILSVTPADAASGAGTRGTDGGTRQGPGFATAGPAKAVETKPDEDVTLEARHYVWVELNGEAYQFMPLLQKVADKLADKPAAPAPGAPGAPAAPAVPKK